MDVILNEFRFFIAGCVAAYPSFDTVHTMIKGAIVFTLQCESNRWAYPMNGFTKDEYITKLRTAMIQVANNYGVVIGE